MIAAEILTCMIDVPTREGAYRSLVIVVVPAGVRVIDNTTRRECLGGLAALSPEQRAQVERLLEQERRIGENARRSA